MSFFGEEHAIPILGVSTAGGRRGCAACAPARGAAGGFVLAVRATREVLVLKTA